MPFSGTEQPVCALKLIFQSFIIDYLGINQSVIVFSKIS